MKDYILLEMSSSMMCPAFRVVDGCLAPTLEEAKGKLEIGKRFKHGMIVLERAIYVKNANELFDDFTV